MMPEKSKGLKVSFFTLFAIFLITMASMIFALMLKIFPMDTYDVGGITLSLSVLQTLLLAFIALKVGKEEGL